MNVAVNVDVDVDANVNVNVNVNVDGDVAVNDLRRLAPQALHEQRQLRNQLCPPLDEP
jgi:hypothetical protein